MRFQVDALGESARRTPLSLQDVHEQGIGCGVVSPMMRISSETAADSDSQSGLHVTKVMKQKKDGSRVGWDSSS